MLKVWSGLGKRYDDADERLRTAPETLTDADIQILVDADDHNNYDRGFLTKKRAEARAAIEAQARERCAPALRPKDISFRNEFLERLNTHAIELAVKHQITVKRSNGAGISGHANFQTRTAYLAQPVTNAASYCVALHEFGHLVSPDADSRQFPYRIEKCGEDAGHKWAQVSPAAETGAWRWAFENAVVWTREMQEVLFKSLRRHVDQATPDERAEMAWLVKSACVRVQGEAWATFEELDERCKEFEPPIYPRSAREPHAPTKDTRLDALAARVSRLEAEADALAAELK